eukprot:scaffold6238_cov104-Isochrysis_galbana.AAC.2
MSHQDRPSSSRPHAPGRRAVGGERDRRQRPGSHPGDSCGARLCAPPPASNPTAQPGSSQPFAASRTDPARPVALLCRGASSPNAPSCRCRHIWIAVLWSGLPPAGGWMALPGGGAAAAAGTRGSVWPAQPVAGVPAAHGLVTGGAREAPAPSHVPCEGATPAGIPARPPRAGGVAGASHCEDRASPCAIPPACRWQAPCCPSPAPTHPSSRMPRSRSSQRSAALGDTVGLVAISVAADAWPSILATRAATTPTGARPPPAHEGAPVHAPPAPDTPLKEVRLDSCARGEMQSAPGLLPPGAAGCGIEWLRSPFELFEVCAQSTSDRAAAGCPSLPSTGRHRNPIASAGPPTAPAATLSPALSPATPRPP